MNTPAVKISRVYVQSRDGIPNDEAYFKAWEGFRKRRVPCELFEERQVHDRTLPLARDTLVVGGLRVVESAMAAVGMAVPIADNLPHCLARYRGRKVWQSTLGELRTRCGTGRPSEPLFVRPFRRNKGFPALAFYDAADLDGVSHLADDVEVLVAE